MGPSTLLQHQGGVITLCPCHIPNITPIIATIILYEAIKTAAAGLIDKLVPTWCGDTLFVLEPIRGDGQVPLQLVAPATVTPAHHPSRQTFGSHHCALGAARLW